MRDVRVRGDHDQRLALARRALESAEKRLPPPTALPVAPSVTTGSDELESTGTGQAVLPVTAPLARLLPAGGLRRGSTVSLPDSAGATSLLFGLLAQASAEGAWAAVVGRPDLGLVAAAEAGIELSRLALVPALDGPRVESGRAGVAGRDAGADAVALLLALLDGMDIVAVAGSVVADVRPVQRTRLGARARQHGCVLIALGPWPGADLTLSVTEQRWHGLHPGTGDGAGRLQARTAVIRSTGRDVAARSRPGGLLLPGPTGRAASPRDRADEALVPVTAAAAG